jgi:hypothetical protein
MMESTKYFDKIMTHDYENCSEQLDIAPAPSTLTEHYVVRDLSGSSTRSDTINNEES